MVLCAPVIMNLKSEISITLHFQPCLICYTALWINNCLESSFIIKVTTMKNQMIFILKGTHHVLPPNQHVSLSAKMNDTLVSKSMKNALYVLWYAKRHILGWSDTKKWKNRASGLSHCRVTLVWRHQAVNQSVRKFCLKACLGIILPNQYYPIIVWENRSQFLDEFTSWAVPTPWYPYYEPLLWFMVSCSLNVHLNNEWSTTEVLWQH